MGNSNEILIADRNPRVRKFLKRELSTTGYHIRLVENGKELLKMIYSPKRIDLLVLDPDFPGVDVIDMTRKIADRIPQLPVVLYCVRGADELPDVSGGYMTHIEKNGNSVEILKQTIDNILSDLPIQRPPLSIRKRG